MTDRITADILVEAFDLAKPDFDDLKDRIEEAAAAHKATLTVDGRLYPTADRPAAGPAVPINSGPGWYEVINPRNATTCIALVYEDGDLYLPEGEDAMTGTEFQFAAARGNAHRMVRADGTGVEQPPAAPPSASVDADLRTLIRGVIRDCPALYPDDIADRVLAALQSAYRHLLARLEADRAGHLRAAGEATEEVLRIDGAVSASTLRHAAAMAVHAFEGPDAAQAYMQRTEGRETVVPVDADLRDRIAEALVFAAEVVATSGPGAANAVQAVIDRVQKALAVLPEARRPFDAQAGLQRLADDLRRGEAGGGSAVPVDRATAPAAFVVWIDASDGSIPTSDGVRWPDGTATIRHRAFRYTTTHSDPEAAAQAAHGKQGRIVWPEPAAADRATVLREAADELAEDDFLLAAEELRRMADETQQAAACDHDSQVIEHEGAHYWACLKCGKNHGRVADEAEQAELVDVAKAQMTDGVQPTADLPAPGEMYRHYKGGQYTVLAVAEDTSTGAPVVVYRDEQEHHWTRPLAEFAGTVADGVRRFVRESAVGERVADVKEQPVEAGESDCRTPETHNWGCGCPTDPPHRGDKVDEWLKQQRDKLPKNATEWTVIDNVLDRYRLHADTGTLLDQHVCEGQAVGDCDCLEQPAVEARQADTAGEA